MIGGDLNEVTWDNEQNGGASRNKPNMERLREAIFYVNLQDMCFSGLPFTWSNRWTLSRPILKWLDRFLGNHAFLDLFMVTRVSHLCWNSSDHCPIVVKCLMMPRYRKGNYNKKRFRFEESWLQEEDCGNFYLSSLE